MTDVPGFEPIGETEIPAMLVEACASPGVFSVDGDCMAGARIYSGDLVVVDFDRAAQEQDIVVFSALGGSARDLKRLVSNDGSTIHLESADGLHLTYGPEDGWSLAVVVASIHRLSG